MTRAIHGQWSATRGLDHHMDRSILDDIFYISEQSHIVVSKLRQFKGTNGKIITKINCL